MSDDSSKLAALVESVKARGTGRPQAALTDVRPSILRARRAGGAAPTESLSKLVEQIKGRRSS